MPAVLAGMLVHSTGPSPCLQRTVGVWQVHRCQCCHVVVHPFLRNA